METMHLLARRDLQNVLLLLCKDSQRKQLVCFYKVEKITTMFPIWEVKNQGWGAIEKLSLLQGLP